MSQSTWGLVPHSHNARVADAKLGYYLGRVTTRGNRGKAHLFVDHLGFDPDDLDSLRVALCEHVQSTHAHVHQVHREWVVYNAIGPFVGANGMRIDRMVTGWVLASGSTTPWSTTAFPARRRDDRLRTW